MSLSSRIGVFLLQILKLKAVQGLLIRDTATTNKFKGNGTTGRSATFTTTVTARVVKVLGNGNVIFEGYREIQLNNETQRLYVAGMIDPAWTRTTPSPAAMSASFASATAARAWWTRPSSRES